MGQSFQLLDEPWILLEDDGGAVREVGLLEAFADAARFRRIVHASPLVTFALYRLLFAIYHRAVPIQTGERWAEVWDAGGELGRTREYLETWRHRFDLFDQEAPFWQVPDMSDEHGIMSWAKLAAELNDNNNKVLFDHTRTKDEPTTDPATVARLLVACQVLSVGAGRSSVGYNVNANLATTLLVIPEGDTLADTLVVNARPPDNDAAADKPIWEQPVIGVAEVIRVNEAKLTMPWFGVARRLTWLTRAIRIQPPEDDNLVRTIHFGAGFRAEVPLNDRDPWAAYRVSKDGEWVPQRLNPERSIWRDLHAIAIEGEAGKREVANVVTRIGELWDAGPERDLPNVWTMLVGGQAADKAKIEGWGQERWRVPDAIRAKNRSLFVRNATEEATKVAGVLQSLTRRLVRDVVAPFRSMDQTEQKRLADALPTTDVFWSSLEAPFGRFLLALGGELDSAIDTAKADWSRAIANAIRASKAATHAALGRSVNELRAWARTAPRFDIEVRRALAEAEAQEGVAA